MEENNSSGDTRRFRTRAIHIGSERDLETGAIVPPIHVATTYVQPGAGDWGQFDYSRSGNPTRARLEQTLASLESGTRALIYASGMAAIHAALLLLKPGDHVVAGSDIYGGTYRLLHQVLQPRGIDVTLADSTDLTSFRAAFRPATKMAWIESPGNPRMTITDIAACAEIAHEHRALLAVDNTFATPALTRPLELGADIVMHSATKYLGGHSDVLGGALVVRDTALGDELYFLQNATGNVLGPFDCFLVARGIKTLELRIVEQSRSAMQLAQWLAADERVTSVSYPGLQSHPGHQLAGRQMAGGYGAMLSFELRGGLEQAKRLVESTRLFQLAVSLGAVESLIELPAAMSHASYNAQSRKAHGITDSLVRLSVGLEATADLQEDLNAALTIATD